MTQGLERKIELLNDYILTLQRENQAKNIENKTLYHDNETLREENVTMRNMLTQIKTNWPSPSRKEPSVKSSFDLDGQKFGVQLAMNDKQQERNQKLQREIGYLQRCVNQLGEQLHEKDQMVIEYQRELEAMQANIRKLEQRIKTVRLEKQKCNERMHTMTKQINLLQKDNKVLRETVEANLTGTREPQDTMKMEQLIRQNNKLIEQARQLEKDKNMYYSELRSLSPLKPRNKQAHPSRKVEKCKLIEKKIQELKSENKQLSANLMVI